MFTKIRSEEDIKYFLETNNTLHDSYIIDAQYQNSGIKRIDNCLTFSPDQTKLTIRILVTSDFDKIVEIEFETLIEWQIKNNSTSIFAAYAHILDNGFILFSSEFCANFEDFKKYSYVIAKSMKWRVCN